jgi:hypothetical protein
VTSRSFHQEDRKHIKIANPHEISPSFRSRSLSGTLLLYGQHGKEA